jgi:BlaI family transcriptional regulator, penicillinase repressor
MSTQPQLSDAEWHVMKALWEHSPANANELCQRLSATRQWHLKTIRTMLTRLVKKRAVAAKIKDGVYHYTALASRQECSRHAAHSLLDRVFDGALAPMVAHLVAQRTLSEEEKSELQKILLNSGAAEKKP